MKATLPTFHLHCESSVMMMMLFSNFHLFEYLEKQINCCVAYAKMRWVG